MPLYGFRDKIKAEILERHANKLLSKEKYVYPQPYPDPQKLFTFTLTSDLAGAGGYTSADADLAIAGPPSPTTFRGTVTDAVGFFAPMSTGSRGLAYLQGGYYIIIQGECQEAAAA